MKECWVLDASTSSFSVYVQCISVATLCTCDCSKLTPRRVLTAPLGCIVYQYRANTLFFLHFHDSATGRAAMRLHVDRYLRN